MPAIASLEDLKAAQKDLLAAKDLNELKAVFKRWRRIGWKNVCGAPHGKGSSHSRAGWGRHPGPKRMVFSAGASFGWRKGLRNN
jgi:hypothetical protein